MTAETGKGQHTPGPWRIIGVSADDESIVANPQGTEVIRLPRHHWVDDEGEANARLIAAAPALLEALRHMCDAVVGVSAGIPFAEYYIPEARAAIRLAEGDDRG